VSGSKPSSPSPPGPALLALRLEHGARLCAARLADLEDRIAQGDVSAWPDLLATIQALATVLPTLTPGARGELMTTAQMAARLNVSSKTLLRRAKDKGLKPVRLGERGRAAIRWRGDEVAQ
jgi:excisionase family DNA binding protein